MKPIPLTIALLLSCSVVANSQVQSRSHPYPQKASRAPVAPATKKNRQLTVGDFKRQFLNQQVVINDVPFNDAQYDQHNCLHWESVRGGHLPIGYRGKTGTIVVIQPAPSSSQSTPVGSTNAFGEGVGEDEVADAYLDVFVKFSDDTMGMVRGFAMTLVPDLFELATLRDSMKAEIESQLPSSIGRTVYAVASSSLYKPTATLKEISDLETLHVRLSSWEMPLLEPLKISKAKYLAETGAVLLRLTLPNGSEAIAYTSSLYLHQPVAKQDFLAHISGDLLTSIPHGLTAREVDAIKRRALFRGMSADAVYYERGSQDSENDWGRGGKQLIYLNGKLFIYLDRSDRVVDVQHLQ